MRPKWQKSRRQSTAITVTRCECGTAYAGWHPVTCYGCGDLVDPQLRVAYAELQYRLHIDRTIKQLLALVDTGHRPKVYIALQC